jgi:DNA-directed RNA polymerase subunit N (RpoN/RPB10)
MRCPTCNHLLSDKYNLYRALMKDFLEDKKKDILPHRMQDMPLNTDSNPVFESLGIGKDRICCRMRLMTIVLRHENTPPIYNATIDSNTM